MVRPLSGVSLWQMFPKAQSISWSFPLNLSSSLDSTLSMDSLQFSLPVNELCDGKLKKKTKKQEAEIQKER